MFRSAFFPKEMVWELWDEVWGLVTFEKVYAGNEDIK